MAFYFLVVISYCKGWFLLCTLELVSGLFIRAGNLSVIASLVSRWVLHLELLGKLLLLLDNSSSKNGRQETCHISALDDTWYLCRMGLVYAKACIQYQHTLWECLWLLKYAPQLGTKENM
jgi:hypothetical protein